jgi:hypothetical protein
MSQIYKTMTGASLTHAPDAVKELLSLGLLKDADILRNKQGDPSGLAPGHTLKDAALGMSDFDLWMSKDLIPAMKAKGYDETQQRAAIARIFKGKIGPGEAEMIMSQMPLIEQHQRNYAATGGRDAAAQIRAADPMKAMEDAATALGNAITALTGDSMKQFATAAEDFAKAVNSFVPKIKAFAESNPLAADVGIGLGAGAASWGAWKGLKKTAPGIFGGGNVAAAGGAAAGGSLFRSVPVLGMAAMGGYSAWQDPGRAFGGSGWEAAKRLWSGEDRGMRTIPGGIAPLASGAFVPGPVTARLDGQAQINVALSIDAPPELLSMIRSGVSTTAFGDLRPNTGVSMPEASPAQGGRNGVTP